MAAAIIAEPVNQQPKRYNSDNSGRSEIEVTPGLFMAATTCWR